MSGSRISNDSLLDYELPAERIAQHPADRRDHSRLMVLRRETQEIRHHCFLDLPGLLAPGDLLVLNDTRVVPARLNGRRARTGGKWQGLFVSIGTDSCWEMMCQTRGRLEPGEIVEVDGGLTLRVLRQSVGGTWQMRPETAGDTNGLLDRYGQIPLPPYIRKGRAEPADVERYQTVFARQPGAVAAPTAGLHFTPEVFDGLQKRGVSWCFVTLHVGPGTFQPLKELDFSRQRLHAEWGQIDETAVRAIEACKERGGKVVAVGTTATRVLETAASTGQLVPWSGHTELFIHPPYVFKVVDQLLTNFHLPRSSLLLLVGAFAGPELLSRAYRTAIDEGYRFYSYGDAMLVL